ncbi:MAG: hypothetical protein OIN85_05270 [Candidatus Methanoperedens sp.]|nr:hypothetical protein [Candidatus Methanoperedens sp.]
MSNKKIVLAISGSIIRDEFYPPEQKIRKEFIKKVEEAERRVKEGKFSSYTAKEFEKRFF